MIALLQLTLQLVGQNENGEFVIGSGLGKEVIQYKEKSLNQFIECTRSVNGTVEDWDSATEVSSNFTVFLNKEHHKKW